MALDNSAFEETTGGARSNAEHEQGKVVRPNGRTGTLESIADERARPRDLTALSQL